MAEGSSEAQKPAADGAATSASPIESLFKRRIEFHPARKPFSLIASAGGDFHLETLNPNSDSHRQAPSPRGSTASAPLAPGKRSDGGEFHDPELSFRITFRRIGAGLANLGNTCFLNSVLQCLTYTEPFAAYLQSGKHRYSCRTAGFCAMCALQNHVMNALQSTGKIVSPHHLVKNLRCISRNFRNSRQEDAHEYMVNLLESMHKCCLPSGVPSESPSAYEKSLVHKIFGGRLRSQVKCVQCSYCSNKFDPFLDLSLEILKADSLHKALRHFTTMETLDGGERQYQCQRCKEKVKAHKQLTIHKAPYVLMVHLKRFRTDDLGKKIDKKVDFEPTLDLKPFVSDPHNGDLKYTLYGVLVHAGWGTHSGHYYCFVRTSSGMWHSLDDNQVVQVSEKTVLAQKAYMLFYVRDRSSAIKGSAYVHKDSIPANGLRNKVIPHSATGLNGAIQNGVAERNLSSSEHSNGKLITDSTSCGQSFSEMDNSSEHPLWKEPSFRKNDNIILKEAPVLQSNVHAIKKEASIFQSNGDFLSQRLQQTALSKDPIKSPSKDLLVKMPLSNQMVTGDLAKLVQLKDDSAVTSHADDVSSTHEGFRIKHVLHLPNGCNAEVESGIPVAHPNNSGSLNLTSDKHTKKRLIENGMHENGDATNDINQNNDTLLQMDGCNVSVKSEPIKFSSQSSPMDGCAQKEALGTVPVEYQSDGLENDELQCRIGGESLLKLEETKAINLLKKPNSSGVQKEKLKLTSTEHSVGNSYRKKLKQKKLAKFSLARGLNFGSKQLFWASLGLHKVKKHKRSKKQHASSGNMIKNEVVYLTTNDVGTSISEACGDSKCPSRKRTHFHSSSEGNIWEVNDVFVGDSTNTKDRAIHERSGKNGLMFANCEQLKRCSSSASNECSTRETDVYGKVQSQHDLMNVLTRGLNEITVARWDGIESQSSYIQGLDDVRNGNIGYVLDEWDEELDRGKRKKIKKHRGDSFGGSNKFQEKANEKAQEQKQLKMKMAMDRTSSGNQPFRI